MADGDAAALWNAENYTCYVDAVVRECEGEEKQKEGEGSGEEEEEGEGEEGDGEKDEDELTGLVKEEIESWNACR